MNQEHNDTYHPPRRVVHIMSELRPGGVEVRTLALLTYLRRDDTQHEIITLSGRAGELANDYRRLGVKVTPMKLRSVLFVRNFLKYLRATQPNVVHSHINHTNGFILALARLAGVNVRISHYRSDTPQVTGLLPVAKRWIMKRLTDRYATIIAGVSPTVLHHAWSDKWEDDRRCQVLMNGFEVELYSQASPADLRREFDINDDRAIILHVGRGVPSKNRARAISILSSLIKSRGPHFSLIFVGRDGADNEAATRNRESLLGLAEEYEVANSVTFAGEREDIAQVLRAGDLLLVTSKLEGLPGVVLEAAACNLPIVSSDLPGVRYIFDNGISVAMVPLESDDSSWVRAIEDQLSRSHRELKDLSSELRSSAFEMSSVAHAYLKVWSEE